MCTYFYACTSTAVMDVLMAIALLVLAVGFTVAMIVKAWRAGSLDRNVEAIIRDARNRAYWRGRHDE
jgi:hypothetical protein